jgi:hypothetical protein
MARRKPQVMDIILRQVDLEMLAGRNVDYLNGHIQLQLLELQLITYSHGDTSWRCEHHENVALSKSFRDSVCGDRLQYRRTHWRRANTDKRPRPRNSRHRGLRPLHLVVRRRLIRPRSPVLCVRHCSRSSARRSPAPGASCTTRSKCAQNSGMLLTSRILAKNGWTLANVAMTSVFAARNIAASIAPNVTRQAAISQYPKTIRNQALRLPPARARHSSAVVGLKSRRNQALASLSTGSRRSS